MPGGSLQVMEPSAYQRQFGVAPPELSHGARIAALIFTARERAHVAALLEQAKIPAKAHMERIVVAPQHAMGAALVFEQTP
jgi:hypothetical protein